MGPTECLAKGKVVRWLGAGKGVLEEVAFRAGAGPLLSRGYWAGGAGDEELRAPVSWEDMQIPVELRAGEGTAERLEGDFPGQRDRELDFGG